MFILLKIRENDNIAAVSNFFFQSSICTYESKIIYALQKSLQSTHQLQEAAIPFYFFIFEEKQHNEQLKKTEEH